MTMSVRAYSASALPMQAIMFEHAASHTLCALPNSPAEGTDRLVELVQQEQDAAAARGEEPALYGAKITGGGCGGESVM